MVSASTILATVDEPCFGSDGQICTLSHHALSVSNALRCSFPDHDFVLSPPPTVPFQTAASTTGRPKKRKRTFVDTESAEAQHHSSICDKLEQRFNLIKAAAREDHLTILNTVSEGGSDTASSERIEVEWAQRPNVQCASQLFDEVVVNDDPKPLMLPFDLLDQQTTGRIVLPPRSAFLMADFVQWMSKKEAVQRLARQWDVLLIDPPWPNRSAARASTYDMFDPYDLWKLDLPALLGDHPCIVAVWVTNRVKYRRLVRDKLFPAWHIKESVEWYWVKTAANGDPVWPFDSVHRRCYEGLLLGRYGKRSEDQGPLPDFKVFACPPFGHSRKPYIIDMLRPFMAKDKAPNVVEMFARMTMAGPDGADEDQDKGFWLSIGNEPIKFNVLQTDTLHGGLRERT